MQEEEQGTVLEYNESVDSLNKELSYLKCILSKEIVEMYRYMIPNY